MTAPRLIATCFGIGDMSVAPGTWASLAAIPLAWALHAAGGLWALGLATLVLKLLGWVLGFLLFRFFDIVKPPPVNWADRIKGPLGVMLDDIVAGALTALITVMAAGIAHGWF